MEIGVVKIAEDSDFAMLKRLVDNHDSWRMEYENKRDQIKVWTKSTSTSSFRMVKIHSVFNKINAETLFDVLHDPDYRKEWDEHMMASIDIGYLNPNNDVGYYALSCPSPLKNRDFVLQRSWLDLNNEKLILNHSVHHKDYGPRRGFIRGISYLTGFVVRRRHDGCFFGYISQIDPRGKLPSWLVNKVTQKLAPSVVKQLKQAAEGYEDWKIKQENPFFKPWNNPEQMLGPKISIADTVDQHPSHTELETDEDT